MYNPENAWGTDMKREPQAVKIRLSKVYRSTTQSLQDVMAELKTLTEKDLQDFRDWFAAAGYPCT